MQAAAPVGWPSGWRSWATGASGSTPTPRCSRWPETGPPPSAGSSPTWPTSPTSPTWTYSVGANLAGLDAPSPFSRPERAAISPATDGPFDLIVAAGNVIALLAPGTEAAVLCGLARRLAPDGLLVAGFGLDAAHLPLPAAPFGLMDYDGWCTAAGLTLDQRFATWQGIPVGPDETDDDHPDPDHGNGDGGGGGERPADAPGYAVSVHRASA